MVPPTASCPGCPLGLIYRFFLKASGPKVIIAGAPSCPSASSFIHDGKPFDMIGPILFGNTPSIVGGFSSALEARGDTETVIAPIIGDGATFDIGFGALSAAAERNDSMLYVCKDNEGYQNTGNQRSSATPWMSTTSTNPPGVSKMELKKDIASILAAHRVPYLATATVGFPEDFMRKVKKAMNVKGFRFIHVLSPCPTGWGFPSEKTVEISRLAVKTNVFPLYEVENGIKYTINYYSKGTPLVEYIKDQRRFRDVSAEDLVKFEKNVKTAWQKLQLLATFNESD